MPSSANETRPRPLTPDPLNGVALAISTYRSDEAVLRRLEVLFADGAQQFAAVIVVDSLGSGRIAEATARRGWPVIYRNADSNLGSAGNLATRLREASATGARWCLALNHDGVVDIEQVRRLVRHGESHARIGAVYPTIIYTERGNMVEAPRTTLAPRASFGAGATGEPNCQEVLWSSSNGALYNLDAIREGVEVWSELWMGWEDLALGWTLHHRGWKQIQCKDTAVLDNYEYRAVRLLGRNLFIADKPSWYLFYQLRNLALIRKRSGGRAVRWPQILRRMAADLAITLMFKRDRGTRVRLLARGLWDGIKGRSGKGPVP